MKIPENLKKYMPISSNGFVSAGLIEVKALKKPLILRPVGYTRMDATLLRNIICRKEDIVNVILYETAYRKTPLIRIGNNILSPVVDSNFVKPDKIEIECPSGIRDVYKGKD